MKDRNTVVQTTSDEAPLRAVIRRREAPPKQPETIQKKLQADVAAWLRERRRGG